MATISPARSFMLSLAAAGAGVVAGFVSVWVIAGGAAGFLSAWAKLGPARAGTAAATRARATSFFMTTSSCREMVVVSGRATSAARIDLPRRYRTKMSRRCEGRENSLRRPTDAADASGALLPLEVGVEYPVQALHIEGAAGARVQLERAFLQWRAHLIAGLSIRHGHRSLGRDASPDRGQRTIRLDGDRDEIHALSDGHHPVPLAGDLIDVVDAEHRRGRSATVQREQQPDHERRPGHARSRGRPRIDPATRPSRHARPPLFRSVRPVGPSLGAAPSVRYDRANGPRYEILVPLAPAQWCHVVGLR